MKKRKLPVFIVSFIIVAITAFIGSNFTSQETNSEWYQSIKPSITPPNYVFPIAWTILFILIVFSLSFSWLKAKNKDKIKIATAFGINFILNALWSFLYFGIKNPGIAFIEIIALWLSILQMIFVTWKIDKKSAYMLIPYLLWVSFAAALNYLSV
jgi:translocator protein